MLLLGIGIVSIVLVLILVILWSGISFPWFVKAVKLGPSGLLVFWGVLGIYLLFALSALVYAYHLSDNWAERGFFMVTIPMFMGIPFRMVIYLVTKNWILPRYCGKVFRAATNEDIDTVTDLIYGVLEEYGLNPDPEETDADLKDIDANYPDNHGSFDVLMDEEGEIIGSVGILRLDEERCELRKMYLKASARGRGYGKLLLEQGLRQARRLGYKRVDLETATVLKEAIHLYRKYGFRQFEAENPSSRCDQMYYLEL